MFNWKIFFSILAISGLFIGFTMKGFTEEKQAVILLGPPGAGKGTHAVELSKKIALPHISTGDIFRENVRNGTELGKKAKEFIDKGLLVPDAIVVDMLLKRISEKDCDKGYILDGFPRTIAQAEALDTFLTKNKVPTKVVDLEIADKLLVDRITGRLMCKSCGAPYHKTFVKPKVEGICDKCGGSLYQRADDTEAVVKERIAIYHKDSAPLIDFYKKKGLLKAVDGSKDKEKVFAELVDIVSKK